MQILTCKNCVDPKCCKMVPPMIFEFEKDKYKNNVYLENYQNKKVSLLRKKKGGDSCIYLKNNKCSVHNNKPFNCKLFPLDIKLVGNKFYWVLWKFCDYAENAGVNLKKYERALKKIGGNELRLYLNYTNNSQSFQGVKFKVLREVKNDFKAPKIEILEQKGYKFMYLNNYLWMWDTPQEIELQEELAKQSFGDVLVAGYGLGILSKFLLGNSKVKSVTTVEIYKEVIEKMKKFDKIYGKIIIDDYYNLPENKKYDCVIGDIWPDIDAKFSMDYKKFKDKARKMLKKNGKILAWGKDFFEYLLKKNK